MTGSQVHRPGVRCNFSNREGSAHQRRGPNPIRGKTKSLVVQGDPRRSGGDFNRRNLEERHSSAFTAPALFGDVKVDVCGAFLPGGARRRW